MIPVFVSLGQSKNPVKRKLEEAIISELGKLAAFDVVVIPNLYDLSAKSESMTALQQVTGDMLVFSWLYQRSTHWILDR
ncbi:MAG: ferredoxin family protein, partial [Pirellulaceae bacterium]